MLEALGDPDPPGDLRAARRAAARGRSARHAPAGQPARGLATPQGAEAGRHRHRPRARARSGSISSIATGSRTSASYLDRIWTERARRVQDRRPKRPPRRKHDVADRHERDDGSQGASRSTRRSTTRSTCSRRASTRGGPARITSRGSTWPKRSSSRSSAVGGTSAASTEASATGARCWNSTHRTTSRCRGASPGSSSSIRTPSTRAGSTSGSRPRARPPRAVELVHSQLDRHGETWRKLRDGISSDGGWPAPARLVRGGHCRGVGPRIDNRRRAWLYPSINRRIRFGRSVVAIAAVVVAAAGCGSSGPRLVVDRRGPQGSEGPARHGVRERPAEGRRVRDSMPSGRLWVATADYTDVGQRRPLPRRRGRREAGRRSCPGCTRRSDCSGTATPLYVTSTGRVDAFSDLRGTKFANRRTILTLPANVGESNNIVLSPDGRMLMGISAPCDHCTPTSKLSGAIVSFRPDGSDLRVYAGGIRAPGRARVLPRHERPLRDDEPARRPRRAHAGRLAGRGTRRARTGSSRTATARAARSCAGVPQPVAVLDKHAAASDVAIVTGQLGADGRHRGTRRGVGKGNRVARPARRAGGTGTSGTRRPFLTGVAESGRSDPHATQRACSSATGPRARSTRSRRADRPVARRSRARPAAHDRDRDVGRDVGAGHERTRSSAGTPCHVDEQHLVVLAHDDVVVLEDPRALTEADELLRRRRTSCEIASKYAVVSCSLDISFTESVILPCGYTYVQE